MRFPIAFLLIVLAAGCVSDRDMQAHADAKVAAEARGDTVTAAAHDRAMSGEAFVDAVEGVGGVALPFAGPYGPIVGVVMGLIVGLARAHNERKKALAIARAIERAKVAGGGVVNFNDPSTKLILNGMGAGSKKLVDEAQG